MPKPKKHDFAGLKKVSTDVVESTARKYTLGRLPDKVADIKHLHPCYSFDYAKLDDEKFSFGLKRITREDYVSLLEGLKRFSKITYGESRLNSSASHFHEVDFDDKSLGLSKTEFYRCLKPDYSSVKDESLEVSVYQFKVFQEARVLGFMYQGVFYLVLFDRYHEVYKRK